MSRGPRGRSGRRRALLLACAPAAVVALALGTAYLWPGRDSGRGCVPLVGMSVGALPTSSGADPAARLDRVAALGVRGIRVDLPWSALQPRRPGATDPGWDDAAVAQVDALVSGARSRGLEVLGILTYAPAWAHGGAPGGVQGDHVLPDDPAAMRMFARSAATRWGETVTAWEVWNEPNIRSFAHPVDPGRYAALVREVAAAVHESRPGAPIAAGALANAADDGTNRSPDGFAEEMLAAGLGPDVSALSVHPYSYPKTPELRWWAAHLPGAQALDLVPRLRHLSEDAGRTLPIWVTEFGSPTGRFRYAGSVAEVSPEDQASAYREASRLLARTDYVDRLYFYTDSDKPRSASDPEDPEAAFGVFTADGQRKPAADAVREASCAGR